jgi:predicted RNA binding protein YcfA (HicA-like mRNA interferase family)
VPPLPVLNASETVRAFESFGWRVARSGNHLVARGTLRSLIRAANLTVEEFTAAVER